MCAVVVRPEAARGRLLRLGAALTYGVAAGHRDFLQYRAAACASSTFARQTYVAHCRRSAGGASRAGWDLLGRGVTDERNEYRWHKLHHWRSAIGAMSCLYCMAGYPKSQMKSGQQARWQRAKEAILI